jgi:DNA-binding beta-propeller fold protein YncE
MMHSMRPYLRSINEWFSARMMVAALGFALAGMGLFPAPAYAARSDLNRDGVVDLEDVKIFSDTVLKQDWQTVDWCQWILVDGHDQRKYDELVDFIREYFQCDQPPEDPLAVENENIYPTRLAWGPDGKLYVSDAKVGSVFIYDLAVDETGQATLSLTGELKRVGKIVGVAVDVSGLVYVGNSQHSRIEKYNLQGELVAVVGEGTVRLPTDLTFDSDNNLYVADSLGTVVWVYRPDGTLLRTIRRGGLKQPMAVEIAYLDDGAGNLVGELYVADRENYDDQETQELSLQPKVKVFDLQGNLLRSFGGFPERSGMMGWRWQGRFVSPQSLAVDHNGNVHALDCYMNKVQILDSLAVEDPYLDSYGESGTAPGQLKVPLDIIISGGGAVVVANAGNGRVEVIHTVP